MTDTRYYRINVRDNEEPLYAEIHGDHQGKFPSDFSVGLGELECIFTEMNQRAYSKERLEIATDRVVSTLIERKRTEESKSFDVVT